MAIPDYQSIMLPLLQFAADGREHSMREAIDGLYLTFSLTDAEKNDMLPSGQQSRFDNRVHWARSYLKQAALVEPTRRGYFRITSRGKEVVAKRPTAINVKYLEQFSEFIEFMARHKEPGEPTESIEAEALQTPSELLESAYQKLREDLSLELLKVVSDCSPSFFERLVIDVLVEMGYGGSRKEAGRAIGQSGDEGIDGIINEDRLGLDVIYIQAKRWKSTIGRPEIQKFAGALQGHRAKKGVFITTSDFTRDAYDYVSKIDSKIVLIDGEHLAQLMIDNNVGVATVTVYETKKIDSDYFIEA